jgi:predicted Zn finger-like uncharacterized protein
MKIVCDNCATKYSIADEKVRGKVFKIRCKKCSHIIVVRGGTDGNAEASREQAPAESGFPGDEAQTIAARGGTPAAALPEAGADAVWHLVIDREQVGPLTPAEVRTKYVAGEIDAETYAWREGFGDWLRLGSIEDFRDLSGGAAADEGATRRTDSADLFAAAGGQDEQGGGEAPAGDLFGGGAAAAAYSSAPAPSAEADVFGGAAAGGGGGLFGAPSAAAPARQRAASQPSFATATAEPAVAAAAGGGGGVDVRPMTGQRNENSVLFSLNNLQALATGGGGAKASAAAAAEARPGFANSTTEGSGLIDIRAMAASTLAASPSSGVGGTSARGDELPGLGAAPVFSPMAAPILMPAAPQGPPKWMWGILGVGVLAVVGIVIVGILLLTRKPELPPAPVAAAPTAAPAPAAPAAAAKAPAAGTPAPGTPAAGAPAAVAAADKSDKKAKTRTPGGTKVAKNDSPGAKADSGPAPGAPPPPAPKKSSKHDELDDLLNGATKDDKPSGSSRKSERSEGGGESNEALPDQLGMATVKEGMGKIKSRVSACFDQYKVPGMATVALTISNSGRVSSANVTGQFAGTPTGECVAKAARGASFPRFKGAQQSIVYPFILR